MLENERIARNEAERASQLKDEFLATLSHELRTPLNAILGWSQLILSGNMKKEDIHKGLETIERNARAQNKLIEDLLEMSSIISGKVRLDMQPLDVASLVEAAVESVKPTAQAKGIILQKTLIHKPVPISGDSNRLQQIFWNLLSNSIKFTPKGGKVDITVEQWGSFLEIRIDDSGLGISPEFMPFVFDRFRQGMLRLPGNMAAWAWAGHCQATGGASRWNSPGRKRRCRRRVIIYREPAARYRGGEPEKQVLRARITSIEEFLRSRA